MKSGIDWNELIPLLPQKMRDDIYLEAVAILSERDRAEAKASKKDNGTRHWRSSGISGRLNAPGRIFRINRNCTSRIDIDSQFGRVWKIFKDSKYDTITTEGIITVSKDVGTVRPADVIWYLWARRFIDVEVKT